jgi:hypothetical protein
MVSGSGVTQSSFLVRVGERQARHLVNHPSRNESATIHPSIGDKNMRHSTSRPRPHTPKIVMNASLVSIGVSETSARTCTSVALWLIKSCQKKLTKQSQSRQRASETRWWRLPQRLCRAGPVLVLVHRVSGRTVWSHQSACRRADRNLARRRRDRWLIRLPLRVYLSWLDTSTTRRSNPGGHVCLSMWCFCFA